MADYIYLLETRLSPAQQKAIGTLRTVARENDMTIFLTGGAVRDLTGGGSVRDLDLTVQGEVSKLKKALEESGAEIAGENAPAQQLFLTFPGGVRVEVASAMNVSYSKPGKPKFEPASLSDDLRRRDFTADAMAISLNDGSYGLLIDPLNGVADIENRELRLVSNYGFIEEPSRLIRAARLGSRLGWQMEERTRKRYDTAKEEGYISALNAWNRGYELEEIFHEEDPVRILRALEAEGWMDALYPPLSSTKANMTALADLAERQGQLQTQGILAQSAALAFPLVTAKLGQAEAAALKAMFVRPGFVQEVDSLDARTREFVTRFGSREAGTPSAAWKMLHEAESNLVLALSYGSKAPAIQTRLKVFLTESPTARQRIPYALMQEMRITPDLPEFPDLVEKLFFQLMDGKLTTPEEMKAYLEPYSPPAPPPPVNLRRARAKKEARPSRAKGKKATEADALPPTVAAEEEATGVEIGIMEPGTLTGPDRGPEPTPRVPLEGKVAPEPTAGPVKSRPAKATADAALARAASKSAVVTSPAVDPVHTTAKSVSPSVAAKKTTTAAPAKAASETSAVTKKPVPAATRPAPTKTANKAAGKSVSGALAKPTAGSTAPAKKAVPPTKKSPTKAAPAAGKKSALAAKAAAQKKSVPAKKSAPAAKHTPAKAGPANAGRGAVAKKAPAKKSPAKKAASRR